MEKEMNLQNEVNLQNRSTSETIEQDVDKAVSALEKAAQTLKWQERTTWLKKFALLVGLGYLDWTLILLLMALFIFAIKMIVAGILLQITLWAGISFVITFIIAPAYGIYTLAKDFFRKIFRVGAVKDMKYMEIINC
jgi:hypothetical protein